jgi:hypothetical protein
MDALSFGGQAELLNDAQSVGIPIVRLAVEHEASRPWNRADLMTCHEPASALLRSHLLPCDPGGIPNAPNDLRRRAMQENRQQLRAVP